MLYISIYRYTGGRQRAVEGHEIYIYMYMYICICYIYLYLGILVVDNVLWKGKVLIHVYVYVIHMPKISMYRYIGGGQRAVEGQGT